MLLTLLGEFVLPTPKGVWPEALINALCALNYKTQAARQSPARSVSAGWLRTERHGRRSRVYLTPRRRRCCPRALRRIYSFGEPWEWEGRWLLVVLRVSEERREIRDQVRTRLAWEGFGSIGGGLWISPHVEREGGLRDMTGDESVAELLTFHAEMGAIGDPARVIADAWDLERVADAYREFISQFGRLRPKTPEATFRAQALLVHAWRKFPFLDPDLPEEMLPSAWPRSRAHEVFHERHALWHDTAKEYFRSLEGLGEAPVRRRSAA